MELKKRRCNLCDDFKSISEFKPKPKNKDGLSTTCNSCAGGNAKGKKKSSASVDQRNVADASWMTGDFANYIDWAMIAVLTLFVASCSTIQKKPVEVVPIPDQKVRYVAKSDRQWLLDTAKVANCVTVLPEFINEIKSIESFYFSKDNGVKVAQNLLKPDSINVYTYKSKWPYSKVNAYRDINTGAVYFNTRNNPRAIEKMVNTIIHERSHIWYDHNGNSATGENLNSVPYQVGNRSEKYVKNCVR